MRSERTELQRTNITSLAAATGIVVFMAWVASFALPHDSLFTHDLQVAPPSVSAAAAPQAQTQGGPNPG
jgi:hypothetical protein